MISTIVPIPTAPLGSSPLMINRKKRTCLKCDRLFDSLGPGNRFCRRCQQINARLPQYTEQQMQKQRGLKRHNGEIMDPLADQ